MSNKNLPTQSTLLGRQLRWRHTPLYSEDPTTTWKKLLAARGLHESDAFFAPRLADLPDPDNMVDMEKASERLLRAILQNEHIHIFGDFDADGLCGTAIFTEALQGVQAHVTFSIPHRSDDGHGIGMVAMQQAVAEGCSLGISVDTGTVCFDACSKARELGLDLIVTDHHLPVDTLPEAFALLNPAREDCGFAERKLCGSGVAFFLLMATWKRLKKHRSIVYDLRSLLDRLAVATVADVMDLEGVNRTLVHHGLARLSNTPSLGMAALLKLARLKNDCAITTEHIAFQLAPRINAAGRMFHADDALKLLLATDEKTADQYAAILDTYNQERRKIETEAFKQAEEVLQDSAVLAAYDQRWHAGVVGLVAGRLARKHARPAAIGFVSKDGGIRVSLRGVAGFHVGKLLQQCSTQLSHFGGHAGAGGGTVKSDCWPAFQETFGHAINQQNALSDDLPACHIDGILRLSALHDGLAERLQYFEPFGRANPPCMWCIPDVMVTQRRELKGGVVRLQLTQQHDQVSAILFAGSRFAPEPQEGKPVTIIASLQKDNWRGENAIQLVVEDIVLQ